MYDLLHIEKTLLHWHQNGSLTCDQMDKRLSGTVKKRDVDKGFGLAINLCLVALWLATQIHRATDANVGISCYFDYHMESLQVVNNWECNIFAQSQLLSVTKQERK